MSEKNKVERISGATQPHRFKIVYVLYYLLLFQYQLWASYLRAVVSLGEIFQNKHSSPSKAFWSGDSCHFVSSWPDGLNSRHNHHETQPIPSPQSRDFPECCMEDQNFQLLRVTASPSTTMSPTIALVPEFIKQANTPTNASTFQAAIFLPSQITR
jgi:hypothetical protein